ncbi:MAG TPA: TIGR01777 family oxidoreductase [Bacteroidia bacterium]|nr:TIGR01777 family oxidoreductase [Bacteroidia bacterium]
MNILIAGASGLIGSHLTELLSEKNFSVGHLVRRKIADARVKHFHWNPAEGKIEAEALSWADALVYLSGAGVSDKRWTEKRKAEIINSRVMGLRLIAGELKKNPSRLKTLVSASAIGWYGLYTSEIIHQETDPPASDFFGNCCREWESAADLFEAQGIRTVKIRTAMVLARNGALPKLCMPVKWFIGSPLGTGRQWMPWIHIEDICAAYLKAIGDNQMRGSYNAAAADQPTNRTFIKTIGTALAKPVFLPPVPKFVMRLLLGEMADLVTEGSRVSNEKLVNAGFAFKFSRLKDALDDLLTG